MSGYDLPASVLARFPAAAGAAAVPMGNRGGFSGARLWRVTSASGTLCLKAWTAAMDEARLRRVHRWMRRARERGLTFVPRVHFTHDGDSVVNAAGRLWDLTEWMQGVADFHDYPWMERIEAAASALALLHEAWSDEAAVGEVCPAVERRRDTLRIWLDLWGRGWRPNFAHQPECLEPAARWALALLRQHLPRLPALLSLAREESVRVQPCLCDIWHDHVLFVGNTVTGIVDYGSMKVDHVAADLARLLGSLAGDDPVLRRAGLEAYRRVRPFPEADEELVNVLDRTGTVLALANWLRWLYHERRRYDDPEAVARRIAEIARRLEG